jgi:prolipoprotein diacylglyceryltransferase
LLGITLSIIRKRVKTKTPQPGKIVAVFLMGYSFIRFFLEYLRADSQLEFHGRFSVSQWFFIGFFILGIVMFMFKKKWE